MKIISNYQFKSKKVQDYLEEKLELLVNNYKSKNGEDNYKIEKLVDSFSQTIFYMENSLLYQHEVHQYQIDEMLMTGYEMDTKDYFAKLEKIDKILYSEVDRSYRNFLTFLN